VFTHSEDISNTISTAVPNFQTQTKTTLPEVQIETETISHKLLPANILKPISPDFSPANLVHHSAEHNHKYTSCIYLHCHEKK
jgi:hypothetical protein